MQKGNRNIAANEKVRYVVAWILLTVFAVCLTTAIVYNSNAVMMAFGKGELHFRSYSDLVQKVNSQPFDYLILNSQTEGQTGSITFQNYNRVGLAHVQARDDQIVQIELSLDRNKFFILNSLDKYAFVDQMLRPLLKSRDVLAAEIAIIQYLSQYALQLKFIDSPQSSTIHADEYNINIQLSDSHIFFTIYPLL